MMATLNSGVELRDVAELRVTGGKQVIDGETLEVAEMTLQALIDELHGEGGVHLRTTLGFADDVIHAA